MKEKIMEKETQWECDGSEEEMQECGMNDTHSSMKWDEFESILAQNGFKIGYEEKFPYENHEEKAVVFYREDGLLIWATSFNNMKSVNGGKLYGEIKLNSVEDRHSIPICSNGFYDFDNLKLYFDKDVREALIWFINSMKFHGEFIPEWEDGNKFVWFLNFIEDDKPGYDYKKISMNKMNQFSDGAKKIVHRLIDSQ